MSGMPGTKGSMRGLTVFISEIRNGKCTIQICYIHAYINMTNVVVALELSRKFIFPPSKLILIIVNLY